MKTTTASFRDTFFGCLEKSSRLTKRERKALWALLSTLIGSSTFSLTETSRVYGKQIGRNFLAQTLKKYSFVQRTVIQTLIKDVLGSIGNRKKLYLIIDDTLLKKSGDKIFGSLKWYNHSSGRLTRAICLVNLGLVVEGKLLLVIPWVLSSTTKPTKPIFNKTKQQDLKLEAAICMVKSFVTLMDTLGVIRQRIIIEADSWYSAHDFRSALQALGLDYRIDGKSSFTVRQIDHEAISLAKTQTRGRRRSIFVKYVKIKQFLGKVCGWRYFSDPVKNRRVYYNKALVDLKTGGKALAYAYKREEFETTKFILVNPRTQFVPDPRTIYRDYLYRWSIEVCHREIKQQFNIEKCQSRDMWVVKGFITFVTFGYSIWSWNRYIESQLAMGSMACPSWSKQFHEQAIKTR